MPKTIKTFLAFLTFLAPVFAFANCGLAVTGSTLTIVVGKNTDKCFGSADFSENFKSTVTDVLDESEVVVARKRAYDERNSRGRKLWAIAERQHQAGTGGRYFGQK
ncbi:MAG TPA: hypothetical protein VGE12_05670 [Noviherbaspirillum sp.]